MSGLLTTGHKDAQRRFPFYSPRSFNVALNTTSESRWPPQTGLLLQSRMICCFIMKINHSSAQLAFYHLHSWNSFQPRRTRQHVEKPEDRAWTAHVARASQIPNLCILPRAVSAAAVPWRLHKTTSPPQHLSFDRGACHSKHVCVARARVWSATSGSCIPGAPAVSRPRNRISVLMTELFVLRTNSLLQMEREGTKPWTIHISEPCAHIVTYCVLNWPR